MEKNVSYIKRIENKRKIKKRKNYSYGTGIKNKEVVKSTKCVSNSSSQY